MVRVGVNCWLPKWARLCWLTIPTTTHGVVFEVGPGSVFCQPAWRVSRTEKFPFWSPSLADRFVQSTFPFASVTPGFVSVPAFPVTLIALPEHVSPEYRVIVQPERLGSP